jgi:protein-disulfide isomerase
LKPWWQLAEESGLKDSAAFAICLSRKRASALIDSGAVLGGRFNVHGTPTVFMNGWRFPNPPTVDELARVATALLAGKKPTANKVLASF